MERTNRKFAGSATARPVGGRFDAMNPASRRVNRSLRAAEFTRFALDIHRDLNPRGRLETLVTRQAIRSAWRLQENIDAEIHDPISDIAVTGADSAARSLEVAITTLDLLQGRRDSSTPRIEPDATRIESNEWPIVPTDDLAAGEMFEADDTDDDNEEDDDPAAPIWRGRLVYDFDVSDQSPVVQGTWITVSHIVSLIVDGATWADILRTHPELTEADIRICVAYAIAEDTSDL